MSLNKLYDGSLLWETDDFIGEVGEGEVGYHIRNKNTGSIELFTDNESSLVIQIQAFQDAYEEIMKDPEREFQVRKAKQGSVTAPAAARPRIVN